MGLTAEEHFNKLEELVIDDNNIVTVPFYALTESIPFEESQKAIETFFEAHKGSGKIHATYVLNGVRTDTGNVSVAYIKDEALKEEQESYTNTPVSTIFSIQKSDNLDFSIISLIQPKSDSKNDVLKLALVVGTNCVKRKFYKKVLPTLPAATVKGKSSIFMKQTSSIKTQNNSEMRDEKSEASPEMNKIKVKSQGSLANLFSNAAQTKSAKQKSTEQKYIPTSGGLSNFVTKQPTKEFNTEKVIPTDIKMEADERTLGKTIKSEHHNEDVLKKSGLFDSDTDEEKVQDLDIKDSRPVKPDVKSGPKKSATSQKRRKKPSTSGNEKSAKRRKRIIVEESESDDMFGSEQSDNEITEPVDLEPEKDCRPLLPKNKRRKSVKKTYEDEEGFIVTQTEYVYETASEEENEPNNKIPKTEKVVQNKVKAVSKCENKISPTKVAKSKKANKKVPPTNQSTLTSFFKKK